MTIEVDLSSVAFTQNADSKTIADIDWEASFRSFERMLSSELRRMHPLAEISVRGSPVPATTILIDGCEIGRSDHPDAWNVHASIHYALGKLFMGGCFWVGRRDVEETKQRSTQCVLSRQNAR